MLTISRLVLSIIVVIMAAYGLITDNLEILPIIMALLGIQLGLTGFELLQKNKKSFLGYADIIIALFLFFVAIQGVMYS
ncbi:DUF3953 domain-containing protein [Virgibacillus halodenitrificans]|uniref:DUF3953 domain-containing protein n=1 Tax=Virgibacillus halodenitrificans TaxID=1482 RepID=UPI0002D9BEAA|nr:DUF3953 domain-containing protein [Virgibacillus halodenitrificans]